MFKSNDNIFNFIDHDVGKAAGIIVNLVRNTYIIEEKIGVFISVEASKLAQFIQYDQLINKVI